MLRHFILAYADSADLIEFEDMVIQRVNKDKNLNLFTAVRGPVALGFIEVDMVIPVHLADPHACVLHCVCV